mmetsp:Transcript_3261/g.5589  ORF Transcript_3261/g.5589 Transcript_3261/m.5589 type:complete len:203 (-) Transcript_3261:310-918(-)
MASFSMRSTSTARLVATSCLNEVSKTAIRLLSPEQSAISVTTRGRVTRLTPEKGETNTSLGTEGGAGGGEGGTTSSPGAAGGAGGGGGGAGATTTPVTTALELSTEMFPITSGSAWMEDSSWFSDNTGAVSDGAEGGGEPTTGGGEATIAPTSGFKASAAKARKSGESGGSVLMIACVSESTLFEESMKGATLGPSLKTGSA